MQQKALLPSAYLSIENVVGCPEKEAMGS